MYPLPPPAVQAQQWCFTQAAQEASVRAATIGTACEDVDRAARRIIAEAGFGEYFVHRTGHGIGMDAHEDPYIVEGNRSPLVAGHAFSIEPGIYLPGRHGARIEDIIICGEEGAVVVNHRPRELVIA